MKLKRIVVSFTNVCSCCGKAYRFSRVAFTDEMAVKMEAAVREHGVCPKCFTASLEANCKEI